MFKEDRRVREYTKIYCSIPDGVHPPYTAVIAVLCGIKLLLALLPLFNTATITRISTAIKTL